MFVKVILRSRGSRLCAIFSSIFFAAFYPFFTGMILKADIYGYSGYVYAAYSDPYFFNTIYTIIVDGWIISVTPLALLLLAINSFLIGLNIGGIISMLRTPGCCNTPAARAGAPSVAASSAILASIGTFSCCGGGLLYIFLAMLGLSAGFSFLSLYGSLLQTIASILLTTNLFYIYRRLKKIPTGIASDKKGFRLRWGQ